MQNLQVIELKGQRVLTTRQLATAYETDAKVIQNNFSRNKDRYIAGKHYIYMERDELREVKITYPQFEGELKRTSRVHFWTEKGALLHAKSLNTDKAWEVYDYLVDFYFRAKEKQMKEELPKKNVSRRIKASEEASICKAIQKIRNDLTCMDVLLQDCEHAECESKYKKHRNAALDIISVMAQDFLVLMDLEPTVLEEEYW